MFMQLRMFVLRNTHFKIIFNLCIFLDNQAHSLNHLFIISQLQIEVLSTVI